MTPFGEAQTTIDKLEQSRILGVFVHWRFTPSTHK